LANFAVPPFFRILGEITIFITLFQNNFFFFFLVGGAALFVSYFNIYLFRILVHGRTRILKAVVAEIDVFFVITSLHMLPIVGLTFSFVYFV
jgi:hypothetical protein